ncbi:biopolymer transport protein ExbB [Sphaerotilus hippei]|uniref:Biopolymer transport protein ExbB n=1 Tax=Sphaerotilus hippei TaxID=744406 RepID=A0A318GYS9_9BURK|nr:biopolymer transport protein ExbB [Sphaerotilus hippei]
MVALAIIIERLTSLRASRVAPPQLLDEVLTLTRSGLPSADVVQKLEASSPLGAVLSAGIRAASAGKAVPEAQVRTAFEASGRVVVHQLERYLSTLGSIATAAPLLGLLGTVIGMIEIFGAQAPTGGGGSNPELLAHGISIALYNTAFGLIIAIPALMFHRHFKSRVNELVLTLEQATDQLLPQLSGGRRG